MIGTGNIQLFPHVVPAAAPTVTGAQNGVGLNGTIVELGFPLIRATDIEQAGFPFTFSNAANRVLSLDVAANQYQFGDIDTAATGMHMTIDAGTNILTVRDLVRNFLTINATLGTGLYEIGDNDSIVNGNQLSINDVTQLITLGNAAGALLTLEGNNGFSRIEMFGNRFLDLDTTTSIYTIGDTNAQSLFTQNTGLGFASIDFNGSTFLLLDFSNGVYQLGDIGGSGNGALILVDDTSQNILARVGGANVLALDTNTGTYDMGDSTGTILNGAFIRIDDNAGNLIIDNTASNMGILINGVAGFTGTVTPVTTITVNNGIVTNVA